MPKHIAAMTVRPADPEHAPKVIFASVDAAYAANSSRVLPMPAALCSRIQAPSA